MCRPHVFLGPGPHTAHACPFMLQQLLRCVEIPLETQSPLEPGRLECRHNPPETPGSQGKQVAGAPGGQAALSIPALSRANFPDTSQWHPGLSLLLESHREIPGHPQASAMLPRQPLGRSTEGTMGHRAHVTATHCAHGATWHIAPRLLSPRLLLHWMSCQEARGTCGHLCIFLLVWTPGHDAEWCPSFECPNEQDSISCYHRHFL